MTLFTIVGGTAIGTIVNGGVETVSGGIASGSVVSSGGLLAVLFGDAAHATVSSGGSMFVDSSGRTRFTTVDGGVETVVGDFIRLPNQDVAALVVNGGLQILQITGTATSATLAAGGTQLIEGSAGKTTISTGGLQMVESGATADTTTLLPGGVQIVSGGAAVIHAAQTTGCAGSVEHGRDQGGLAGMTMPDNCDISDVCAFVDLNRGLLRVVPIGRGTAEAIPRARNE